MAAEEMSANSCCNREGPPDKRISVKIKRGAKNHLLIKGTYVTPFVHAAERQECL